MNATRSVQYALLAKPQLNNGKIIGRGGGSAGACSFPITGAGQFKHRVLRRLGFYTTLFAAVLGLGLGLGSGLGLGASSSGANTAWATTPSQGATPSQPPTNSAAAATLQQVSHGIAMHGVPRQSAGFSHFSYANPKAKKGGRLTLGTVGTFDNLNPLIIKGVTPPGIRGRVYESLMARALDEPFTLYGLLAQSIEVAPDRSSITFTIHKKARFSDGKPVTADDVIFTHALLRDNGVPYLRSHYKKVVKVDKRGPLKVKFTFKDGSDREIALIMGLMPILPKHAIDAGKFKQTTLEPPIGSGPYQIAKEGLEPGRGLTFKRNPNYWGKDLNVNVGRNNFDEIRYIYFRDRTALFEAFKVGEIDFRVEGAPGRWAKGYEFTAARDGRVVRRQFKTGLPSGMAALAFNSRREIFKDVRVRRALIKLYDFEWINASLFHGLYKRTQSFFDRSILSSHGRPVDARERELLAPFKSLIKPALMDGSFKFPKSDGTGRDRTLLREAHRLLTQAGYQLKGRKLVNKKTGKPFEFEFLALSKEQERMMLAYGNSLARLGIKVIIRKVDNSQYWARLRTFDYDMIQWNWSASLSPGNEQINRWSSAAAAREGSLNFANARSPAVDAMIENLLAVTTQKEFVSAVRAYDRALLSGDHVIPLYHLPGIWVAHWNYLKSPEIAPLWGYSIDHWWRENG